MKVKWRHSTINMSALQYKMFERLKKGDVKWTETTASETHSLKSLVKHGIADVHGLKYDGSYGRETYWSIKK